MNGVTLKKQYDSGCMTIGSLLALLFGSFIALVATVYCAKPDMIVRQANQKARPAPVLLHFALPIQLRGGLLTAQQVRSTGLGLFLLGAWFLLVAITSM
jgi:hypothetical protein